MGKELQNNFFAWTDYILLQKIPATVIAFCFNLSETQNSFQIQLVGAPQFSEDDSDWACDEVFTSGTDLFDLPRIATGQSWEEGLDYSKRLISSYLKNGTQASKLKSVRAVAVGFIDGDLEILHQQ